MSFPARYEGACARPDCSGIKEGDDIVRSPTNAPEPYQHLPGRCRIPADLLEVTRPPCSSCFMVPAANGACGCDQ